MAFFAHNGSSSIKGVFFRVAGTFQNVQKYINQLTLYKQTWSSGEMKLGCFTK